MSDTDRLAALLHELEIGLHDEGGYCDGPVMHEDDAARLVAAGVRVGINPDRLARALEACPGPWPPNWTTGTLAAAVAKAYEEGV